MKYHEIISALHSRFHNHKYVLTNSFVFSDGRESDWFSVTTTDYCYEIEIKTSRSDFKADFKKARKHSIFSNYKCGWFIDRHPGKKFYDKDLRQFIECSDISVREIAKMACPNRFYYCCPGEILKVHDIPEYAGLIQIIGPSPAYVKIIKEAPFLHKGKRTYRDRLVDKFYWKYRNLEQANFDLQRQHDNLFTEFTKLKEELALRPPANPR